MNNLKTIRIKKLKEADNPIHPDNIPVDFIRIGAFIAYPQLEQRFYVGFDWSTSAVQEILPNNQFRTLNSIYEWEFTYPELTLQCAECNGYNIQTLAWVDANTNVFKEDYDGDEDSNWCENCKKHVKFNLTPIK